MVRLHDKWLGDVRRRTSNKLLFVVEESNLQLANAPRVGTSVGDEPGQEEVGTLWPVLPRCAHNRKVVL